VAKAQQWAAEPSPPPPIIQFNSIQFKSQQLQGQLHTQHSVITDNSIKLIIIFVPSQQLQGQLQQQ
jgi:hypothetical protein